MEEQTLLTPPCLIEGNLEELHLAALEDLRVQRDAKAEELKTLETQAIKFQNILTSLHVTFTPIIEEKSQRGSYTMGVSKKINAVIHDHPEWGSGAQFNLSDIKDKMPLQSRAQINGAFVTLVNKGEIKKDGIKPDGPGGRDLTAFRIIT